MLMLVGTAGSHLFSNDENLNSLGSTADIREYRFISSSIEGPQTAGVSMPSLGDVAAQLIRRIAGMQAAEIDCEPGDIAQRVAQSMTYFQDNDV
jgi:hypothetical protein